MDKKGCSKLYKLLKGSNSNIIDKIVNSWENKCNIQLASFDISTSFYLHHACYNDTYLKYILFQTLHKRFFTNEKLFKMGIRKSPLCSLCKNEEDNVEHILIECPVSKELWHGVRDWIIGLGIPDYSTTGEKSVMGELEKSICINSIILLTKKLLYNCMKEVKFPHILMVKNETKNFYYQEKYRFCVEDKNPLI